MVTSKRKKTEEEKKLEEEVNVETDTTNLEKPQIQQRPTTPEQEKASRQGVPVEAIVQGKKDRESLARQTIQGNQVFGGTSSEQSRAKLNAISNLNEQQQAELQRLQLLRTNDFQTFLNEFKGTDPAIQNIIGVDEQGNPITAPEGTQIPQTAEQFQDELISKGFAIAGGTLAAASAVAATPTLLTSIPEVTASLGSVTKTAGLIGTALFGGGVVKSLLTTQRERNIEGDISALASSTSATAKDVLNGANPQQAIDQMKEIEAEIINLNGKLHLAYKNNPTNWVTGKDVEAKLFKDLNTIIRRRQAIERYQLTGDKVALQTYLGQFDFPTE